VIRDTDRSLCGSFYRCERKSTPPSICGHRLPYLLRIHNVELSCAAFEDEPKHAVRAATEGRGVDVVVDAVGDPGPLAMAVSLARDAGTVSGIGAYAGKGEVPLGL